MNLNDIIKLSKNERYRKRMLELANNSEIFDYISDDKEDSPNNENIRNNIEYEIDIDENRFVDNLENNNEFDFNNEDKISDEEDNINEEKLIEDANYLEEENNNKLRYDSSIITENIKRCSSNKIFPSKISLKNMIEYYSDLKEHTFLAKIKEIIPTNYISHFDQKHYNIPDNKDEMFKLLITLNHSDLSSSSIYITI